MVCNNNKGVCDARYRDDSDPRKGGFGGVTELVSELVVILLGNANPQDYDLSEKCN